MKCMQIIEALCGTRMTCGMLRRNSEMFAPNGLRQILKVGGDGHRTFALAPTFLVSSNVYDFTALSVCLVRHPSVEESYSSSLRRT
jgi:hypothetical protein